MLQNRYRTACRAVNQHIASRAVFGLCRPANPPIWRVAIDFRQPSWVKNVQLPLIRNNWADMEKIPMTRAGHTALNDELKTLKSVERPAIIRAVAEARDHGDLSENAEYHSAREKHSFIEGRIKELAAILSLAEVINPASLSGTVKFGATVTLVDEDTDEEKTYQIVGEPEADIEARKLNIKSPLARALIGKDEGDSVEVRTPGGEKSYEILSIKFV